MALDKFRYETENGQHCGQVYGSREWKNYQIISLVQIHEKLSKQTRGKL